MISDAVELDAAEAIDSAKAYADALKSAADSLAGLQDKSAALDFSGAGPDKLAASWDAAAGQISASIDKITASLGRLDDLGAAGAGGADKVAASWDDAAGSVSASLDKITASAGKLDDVGAGASAEAPAKLAAAWDDAAGDISAAADKIGESTAKATGFSAGDDALAGPGRLAAAWDDAAASVDASAARITAAQAGVAGGGAAGAADSSAAKQAASDASAAEASAAKYHMLALGGAVALGYGIDLAAKLQTGVTRLYTSAGESQANLPMISKGILGLSGQVDQSQANLLGGAYYAESAGFHGANALAVERAAGEGATSEGAQLSTVSNALTTLLNDYYGGPAKSAKAQQDQATSGMNAIMAAVGSGKMTLQDLSSAMPVLLPVAKSAGLSLGQILGAEATMTAQGTSAQAGAQEIRHTIGALQKPSGVQAAEMQMLGINPLQLESDLGKQGLTGTIGELDAAVKSHTKNGMVDLDVMNQSKLAVQSANQEITALPRNLQGAAKQYLAGTMSESQWYGLTGQSKSTLSASDVNLLKQFADTANAAHGFSTLEKAGLGDKQTTTAALNALTGGQMGQQVALQVGGSHLGTFTANVKTAGDAAKESGDNIRGWSDVTKTLNFQLGAFKNQTEAVATEAGQVALPALTGLMKGLSGVGGFLASNPEITKPLLDAGGVLAGVTVASKVASAGTTALATVGKVAETLNIPGLSKLSGLGKDSGAATMATAADGNKLAADTMATAADGMKTAADTMATASTRNREAADTGDLGLLGGGTSAAEKDLEEEAEGAGGAGMLGKLGMGGASELMGPAILAAITIPLVENILSSIKTGPHGQNMWNNPFGANPASKSTQKQGVSTWAGLGWQIEHAGGLLSTPKAQETPADESRFTSRFGINEPGTTVASTAAPKIAAPDTSSVDKATADSLKDVAQIEHAFKIGKPPAIPAPDTSQLEGTKSKVAGDMNGIVSAMKAAEGPARAAGAAVSEGLASGITAEGPQAIAAAHAVAAGVEAAMKSALQTSSPSKVTTTIGADTAAGLVVGLEGGQSAVNAAATALGKNAAKATDLATLDSNVTKLLSYAPSGDTGLTKMLKGDESKLTALMNKRQQLETEITDSQQIAQQALSSASILNAGSYTPALAANGPQASSATVQGMQQMEADQKAFATQIGQLEKEGLNSTSVNQLVQGGATSGLPITAGLVGNKSAITQINQLEAQIKGSAAKLGDEGAPAMYQAGVQAGQGLAQGIESQLGTVDAAIKTMAQQMVNSIKSALKSHSPSLVFAEIGLSAPQGMAMGVDQGAPLAVAAVGRMGSRMTAAARGSDGSDHPGLYMGRAGGSRGGGTTVTNHYVTNVTVQGSVTAAQDLHSTLQEINQEKAFNNWQAGWTPAARAG